MMAQGRIPLRSQKNRTGLTPICLPQSIKAGEVVILQVVNEAPWRAMETYLHAMNHGPLTYNSPVVLLRQYFDPFLQQLAEKTLSEADLLLI